MSKMGEKIAIPSGSYPVRYTSGETLMTFGKWFKQTRYTTFVGIGKVTKVRKGDKLDIVNINFGRIYARELLVYDNHARRQIYTLKRGQYTWVIGYMRKELDKETKEYKTIMLAYGFQAWYVPKTLDIKNEEYDLDSIEELTKDNETSMLTFLDEITGGNNNGDD